LLFKNHIDEKEYIDFSYSYELKTYIERNSISFDIWSNGNKPFIPDFEQQIPGILWINGERLLYWTISEELFDSGRSYYQISDIVRGSHYTSFFVKENTNKAVYTCDGINNIFNIPTLITTSSTRITVKLLVDGKEITLIEKDPIKLNLYLTNQYVNNAGFYNWDYEIIGNQIHTKTIPVINSVIVIEIFDDILTNTISHNQGDSVNDGSVNNRLNNFNELYQNIDSITYNKLIKDDK
jgi:hypothetical protein